MFMWDVITYPCLNFDGGLTPPLLKLGHGQSVHCISYSYSLQWRHNGRDSVSNHQRHDCFLNRLFRRRSMKTSKLRVTGLCEGNSPVTGASPHRWFPAQMANNAEIFPLYDVIMCRCDYSFISWIKCWFSQSLFIKVAPMLPAIYN